MRTLHLAAGQTFVDPANGLLIEIGEHGTNALVHYPDESRPKSAVGSRMLDFARGIKADQIQLLDKSAQWGETIASHLRRQQAGGKSGQGARRTRHRRT